jgi:aryl-alcohol dehydrogenase-like predicted oxidoreductase
LGTMTFGEDWGWGAPREECRRIFDAYADAGGNVIDTAVNYTGGASERIAIARAVQVVADDLGVTPSQVAIAWTMARSPTVHPIVGARRLDQLVDNLGAVDCRLDSESLCRLDDASAISLGFPHDFISETAGLVYGPAGERVVPRGSRP